MSHTIFKVYMHIVLSTKKRQPLITPENENPLYEYVHRICKSLECWPLSIGGSKDHIHILCRLSKDISVVELIEEIKISSTRWAKSKSCVPENFSWQQGFASFSVGEDDLPQLCHYIEKQKEHHAMMSFEEEYRKLLDENEVEYDNASIWK
jgi:putative transposase